AASPVPRAFLGRRTNPITHIRRPAGTGVGSRSAVMYCDAHKSPVGAVYDRPRSLNCDTVGGHRPPLQARANQRGATTVYFALFTLVALGLLVMATDVGRLYLIQGELQTAADAAALAAATQLVGTINAATQPAGRAM